MRIRHGCLTSSNVLTLSLLSVPCHGQRTAALASSTDILPTVLDWFSLSHPSPSLKLTGRSLLPLTADPANVTAFARVFSSHNLNDVSHA